jgi:hypothetical protein
MLHRPGSNLCALLFALASCARPRPVSPATAFVAPATGPAAYAVIHVDHLRPGALKPFVQARRRWLDVLSRRETTDGRGLFVQTGDSGFLSVRPVSSLGEVDRQASLVDGALSRVDPLDRRGYDDASDALLVPPHRSEIWRFDQGLSYGTLDPVASLTGAAWGKMTVEEIDPTPAGRAYEEAWQEVHAALVAQSYPLVRVSYWSRYGTGNLVSFWLAQSQRAFLETMPVEAAVAAAIGQEAADAVFARMRATVLASDSIDVIPRVDLSSKTL